MKIVPFSIYFNHLNLTEFWLQDKVSPSQLPYLHPFDILGAYANVIADSNLFEMVWQKLNIQ